MSSMEFACGNQKWSCCGKVNVVAKKETWLDTLWMNQRDTGKCNWGITNQDILLNSIANSRSDEVGRLTLRNKVS